MSIIIAAVLVSATLYLTTGQTAKTVTQTSTFTTTSAVTRYLYSTTSIASTLAEQCSSAPPPNTVGLLLGNISAGTSTPAIICIQYYLFSQSSPVTMNLTGALSINGVGHGGYFDGSSNFTVGVSQGQLTLGGSENESEGAVVAFGITSEPGASGTYELDLSGGYMLTGSEPVQCAYYGQLIAGDGQPDYVIPTGCLTIASSGTGNPTIPGISYPLIEGILYFRVVGVIDSA